MRPDESIEDVLEQIALERISLDAPRYGRGTVSVEAKKTQAELGGEERLDSLVSDTSLSVRGRRNKARPESGLRRPAKKGHLGVRHDS